MVINPYPPPVPIKSTGKQPSLALNRSSTRLSRGNPQDPGIGHRLDSDYSCWITKTTDRIFTKIPVRPTNCQRGLKKFPLGQENW